MKSDGIYQAFSGAQLNFESSLSPRPQRHRVEARSLSAVPATRADFATPATERGDMNASDGCPDRDGQRRAYSGRPPKMKTTPAQLETPWPTSPRYLV